MVGHSTRRIVFLLVFAIVSVGQAPATFGQGLVPEGGDSTADLVRTIEEMQRELSYLRERDTQRQAWESSVVDPLPEVGSTASPVSYNCEIAGCETCQSTCGGSSCSCHTCQAVGLCTCVCPPKPAPCIACPRVSTLGPYFNVHLFGNLTLDALFLDKRPLSPGTPYFLFPDSPTGLSQSTFDAHARQSALGAAFTGPKIGSLQSGGMVMAFFYNDNALADAYGILPGQVYGDLKNENWRFAAGLQADVFNPGAPTVLPFSALCGSGNAGNAWRGQIRLERFLRPSATRQWTLQMALSEPITSVINPDFRLLEDNGWPNIEGRIALGLGCLEGAGASAKRPFEVGISGVVGEIRNTDAGLGRVVADVWGLGTDVRWNITDAVGLAGEFYTGQTLGTYNGGVLQNVNVDTLQGIRSTGGWGEVFAYWTPCLHSHLGYGIDDPLDNDVATSAAAFGRLRNRTVFGNLLWDITTTFRIGFELAWRETVYKNAALPDNEGIGFHTQFRWAF